jgi:hypothetical protein
MIRLQRSSAAGRLLIALLALSMSPNLYAQHQKGSGALTKPTAAKIARLLDQSGYTYTKAGETVWTIAFKGKALADFKVVITFGEGFVVVFVVVVEKKNLNGRPPELMYKLLKFNDYADFVKLGFDDDDDLDLSADLRIRTLDLQELKDTVEQVAAAADQVYATVRPYMTAH